MELDGSGKVQYWLYCNLQSTIQPILYFSIPLYGKTLHSQFLQDQPSLKTYAIIFYHHLYIFSSISFSTASTRLPDTQTHFVKSVQVSVFSCIRTRKNSVFGNFSRSDISWATTAEGSDSERDLLITERKSLTTKLPALIIYIQKKSVFFFFLPLKNYNNFQMKYNLFLNIVLLLTELICK